MGSKKQAQYAHVVTPETVYQQEAYREILKSNPSALTSVLSAYAIICSPNQQPTIQHINGFGVHDNNCTKELQLIAEKLQHHENTVAVFTEHREVFAQGHFYVIPVYIRRSTMRGGFMWGIPHTESKGVVHHGFTVRSKVSYEW